MSSSTRATCAWCDLPLTGAEKLPRGLRCRSCGVATTDPWPTEAQLDAAYGTSYRPPNGRFFAFGDAILVRTRARLSKRLDRIAPTGPILDVGAGPGTLVEALQARGRGAVGLERGAAGTATRELTDMEPGNWAAIIFWHSLEHLREPGSTIDQAAQALCPEGVVIVAVPNSASLQARAFGARWLAIDFPRHLIHLNTSALLKRLRNDGMRIERISYLRGGQVLFGWLHGIVGLLPGHPDLYDAIRRPEARSKPISTSMRWTTLTAALLALPLALLATAVEVATRKGGTVYVEARRA